MRREEKVYVWQDAAEICGKLRTYLDESGVGRETCADVMYHLNLLHKELLDENPSRSFVNGINLAMLKSSDVSALPLPDWWKTEYRRMWQVVDKVL